MTKNASASAVGLIARRSPRQFATDPFYSELIGGLESVLGERGLHVLMRAVDAMPAELAEYRRWAAERSVCAVLLVDLVPDDPRPALIAELGLPAVIIGEPAPGVALPAVRADNRDAMRGTIARLVALGHRRIARVTGLQSLVHTQERTQGYTEAMRAAGLEPLIREGDYSSDSGAAATRELLAAAQPPTAVVYDNDAMAVAGLAAAKQLGVAVPDQVSLVAWDDSHECQLADPPLSALSHDVHARGALAGRALISVLDGEDPGQVFTPASVLVERGSTAAAQTDPASATSIS